MRFREVRGLKMRSAAAAVLSLLICLSVLCSVPAGAAVFPFETQYDYANADPAWLTDLVIKEDLEDVSQSMGRCTLAAAPDYPYTETPASFKSEVEQFCALYSLDETAYKAAYLYLLETLGANSSVFAAQATDAQVRTYLQNAGIAYPADASAETKVLATALYTAMATGAFSSQEFESGVALERALTKFIVKMSGFSEADLAEWIPGGMNTPDDYMLAVSRMTLWSNGYDVTPETEEDEVYRLMAVMTIRNLGVSVDTDVSFSELQAKYTAALLGKKYGVTADPDRLASEIGNNSAAFYILQLIGKQNGLTVRSDSMSYEDAFDFVASYTNLFDIEENEFYADIYKYDIYLSAPRSVLWVYPTSYYGTVDPAAVSISCNGQPIKDNYFTQVAVSPSQNVQKLTITVNCVAGTGSVKEYVITVHSEDAIGRQNDDENTTVPESEGFLSSNTIVSRILASAGVDAGIAEAAGNLIKILPQSVQDAFTFITPTFDDAGSASDVESPVQTVLPSAANQLSAAQPFIGVLDSIGAYLNSNIGGIGGIGLTSQFSANTFDYNFITID